MDALEAATAGGASHAGFIFFAKSPRHVTPQVAASLAARARERGAQPVAVTVDADDATLDAIVETVRPGLENAAAVLSAVDAAAVRGLVADAASFAEGLAAQSAPLAALVERAGGVAEDAEAVAATLAERTPRIVERADATLASAVPRAASGACCGRGVDCRADAVDVDGRGLAGAAWAGRSERAEADEAAGTGCVPDCLSTAISASRPSMAAPWVAAAAAARRARSSAC